MTVNRKIKVSYVTRNEFKIKENEVFRRCVKLEDGALVDEIFEFDIRRVPIKEVLEIDLREMVAAEVVEAYQKIRIPCIVEHAGLVFEEYDTYPGGLTKPMWDFLKDRFVSETKSAGRRVKARAVVAYCDGRSVVTFVGETPGRISEGPRGSRQFYWDTVFIPDLPDGSSGSMTYAEIVEDKKLGLEYKMSELSQSTRAMVQFLKHRRTHSPHLWANV
jgi:inosine/xanthosine triphosphate pyrophosphatase family protein